jgi:AraC-like DNA-binding protein
MDKSDICIYLSATMWADYSTQGEDRRQGGGLCLHTVWHVRADPSYDVRRGEAPPTLIAIRTLAGTGQVELRKLAPIEAMPNSVLIAENRKIARYFCTARQWHFWWFEFTMAGPVFFDCDAPVICAASPHEETTLSEIFRNLRRPSPAHRSLASAEFACLAHRWMTALHAQRPQAPHQAAIERVVDTMHERPDGTWSVRDMARSAGLSERRFRQVFQMTMRATPKQFYDGVRLELGRRILVAEGAKISDVADRLGFSSPFHFSRAYRARYGQPPSGDTRGRV